MGGMSQVTLTSTENKLGFLYLNLHNEYKIPLPHKTIGI